LIREIDSLIGMTDSLIGMTDSLIGETDSPPEKETRRRGKGMLS